MGVHRRIEKFNKNMIKSNECVSLGLKNIDLFKSTHPDVVTS